MLKFIILILLAASSEAFDIVKVTATPSKQIEGGTVILR